MKHSGVRAEGATGTRTGMRMRMITVGRRWARWLGVGAAIGAASVGAHAQLFPDNEARRAIVEIRERMELDRKSLTETDIKLTEQLQQLQRSLLELTNQIEQLKGEVAKLRGTNEQLARDLADVQRKQKDMQQAAAEQASAAASAAAARTQPQRVTMDGREFTVEPDEKKQFEDALTLLRQGDYNGGSNALAAFRARWPQSGYGDAARFWHANALYGKRDYRESVAVFKAFMVAAPDHPRVPEAMLATANAQLEMKDTRAARTTLNDLIKTYPRAEAAQAAKERLAAIR